MNDKAQPETVAELEQRLRTEVLAAVDRRFDELAVSVRAMVAQGLSAQSAMLTEIRDGVLALRERLESRPAPRPPASDVLNVAERRTERSRETTRRHDRAQAIVRALYALKIEEVDAREPSSRALLKDGGAIVERFILRENELGDMLPEEFDGIMGQLELELGIAPPAAPLPRAARPRAKGFGAFLDIPTGRRGAASGR